MITMHWSKTENISCNALSHEMIIMLYSIRVGTREFPPGNSREFPEKILSRSFPGIFSISREISGNFYILSSQKFLDFTNFGIFFLLLRIKICCRKRWYSRYPNWKSLKFAREMHFLSKVGFFDLLYSKFEFPGNSRSREIEIVREIPNPISYFILFQSVDRNVKWEIQQKTLLNLQKNQRFSGSLDHSYKSNVWDAIIRSLLFINGMFRTVLYANGT